MAPRVDFMYDSYHDPSIKVQERDRQGVTESTVSITGPDQRRPRDCQKALLSLSFNQTLVRFLVADWSSERPFDLLWDHQVYLA